MKFSIDPDFQMVPRGVVTDVSNNISFRDPVFDDAPISSDDPNGSMSDPVTLPARIVLADFKTRYHGYYSQDFRTAYLTHTTGDGTPYIMFFEFGEFSLGKEVQVKQNTGIFDFQSKTFTVEKLYTGETLWNLDDTKVTNHNGIDVYHGYLPKGTHRVTFVWDRAERDYTIVVL